MNKEELFEVMQYDNEEDRAKIKQYFSPMCVRVN